MDIRRLAQATEEKFVIMNIGDPLKSPTHAEASRAPSLAFCNIQKPVTNDLRYQKAIHSLEQLPENVKNISRNTLSFPNEAKRLFELKMEGPETTMMLTAAPSYKIWKIEFTDDGMILHFINSVFVPDEHTPITIGQAIIQSPYIDLDIIAGDYDDYPMMKYSCALLTDCHYPEIKQRNLQIHRWDKEKEEYMACGSLGYYRGLNGETTLSISTKQELLLAP